MINLNLPLHRIHWPVFFVFLFPSGLLAKTMTWTGSGGDAYWANPMNWSGVMLPGTTDDVILDNSVIPLTFQVVLPDVVVSIRTLQIQPSSGRNIELILPASNKVTNGFTVSGPGYGIALYAGAVFRNASGITSGESLSIADLLIIYNGARYIHQTKASHANGILRILSVAPGTELGIFDFDVPRASYTISVSNRVYGCLELHAIAMGSAVNYTCSGANPLLVRGNLRIGTDVSMSMNLSGPNGNMQIDGDFIQEGGQLNLAVGTGGQTVLCVRGNITQSASSVITETANGNPYLELNGFNQQEINMAGQIRNQVGFRINNPAGGLLRLPLLLPCALNLVQGVLISSTTAMLILDTVCTVLADSSRQTGTCVEGPLRKLGLQASNYFLFPVGKSGSLRWLALREATGDLTVEYFRNDPAILGINLAPDLDHISKLEYWTVQGSGQAIRNARIELSFASAQCGGVTDPQFLNVAVLQSGIWEDAGHSATTGNAIQGSVISDPVDSNAGVYTLASTANLENPLPLTSIELAIQEVSGETLFTWTYEGSEVPDHFDLEEEKDSGAKCIAQIPGAAVNVNYHWIGSVLKNGDHFFRIKMTDIHGIEYFGKTVLFTKKESNEFIVWLTPSAQQGNAGLMIEVDKPAQWKYEILSVSGATVKKGFLYLYSGKNNFRIIPETLAEGIYILVVIDASGERHVRLFRKN
jgi:hypothetical protein